MSLKRPKNNFLKSGGSEKVGISVDDKVKIFFLEFLMHLCSKGVLCMYFITKKLNEKQNSYFN